jgi:hypothetical protein
MHEERDDGRHKITPHEIVAPSKSKSKQKYRQQARGIFQTGDRRCKMRAMSAGTTRGKETHQCCCYTHCSKWKETSTKDQIETDAQQLTYPLNPIRLGRYSLGSSPCSAASNTILPRNSVVCGSILNHWRSTAVVCSIVVPIDWEK